MGRVEPATVELASGARRLRGVSGMCAVARSPTGLEIPIGMYILSPSLVSVKTTDSLKLGGDISLLRTLHSLA